MNILAMLGGQQDPKLPPLPLTPEEQETDDILRVAEQFGAPSEGEYTPSQLREILSTSTDPSVIQAALDQQDPERAKWRDKPLPPRPQRYKKEDRSWLGELFKDFQLYTPGSQGQQLGGRPTGMGGLTEREKERLSNIGKDFQAGKDFQISLPEGDTRDIKEDSQLGGLKKFTDDPFGFKAAWDYLEFPYLKQWASETGEYLEDPRATPWQWLPEKKKVHIKPEEYLTKEQRKDLTADKDGPAKESPTAIATPEEGKKNNVLPMKMWGLYNKQLQQAGAIAEKTGVHIDQVMKEMISKETGASKDDVDTTIGDLTQKLHEALDRKPAWEEILMAFSLILVGMDGVSFLQRLKQENIDRANLIRNLIKDEKEYELSKEALGVSKAKEFRTLAEKQQDKIFKRREKGASTALSAIGRMLSENKYQQEKLEYIGDKPTKDQLDQRSKLMKKNKLLRDYQQLLYGQ